MTSATFEDHPTDPEKIILRKKPYLDKGADYEHGFIDGMQHQMRSSVDKAVNAMAQPEQEPVAWADHGVINWIVDKQFKHASYLYEGSPPALSKACVYCGRLVIKE